MPTDHSLRYLRRYSVDPDDDLDMDAEAQIAPGKRVRTQDIRRAPSLKSTAAAVQAKAAQGPAVTDSTPAHTAQWFDVAVRPDLHASPVQRKESDTSSPRSSSSAAAGSPLPDAVQAKMDHAFDTDFSAVRIHEGGQAQALGALAFTQGSDIHFAPGQYAPDSQSGQELLGHELTHVVQQSQGRVRQTTAQAKGLPVNIDRELEREADELGARAARGERVMSGGGAAPTAAAAASPVQAKFPEGKEWLQVLSSSPALASDPAAWVPMLRDMAKDEGAFHISADETHVTINDKQLTPKELHAAATAGQLTKRLRQLGGGGQEVEPSSKGEESIVSTDTAVVASTSEEKTPPSLPTIDHPGVEVHNHFSGVLTAKEFLGVLGIASVDEQAAFLIEFWGKVRGKSNYRKLYQACDVVPVPQQQTQVAIPEGKSAAIATMVQPIIATYYPAAAGKSLVDQCQAILGNPGAITEKKERAIIGKLNKGAHAVVQRITTESIDSAAKAKNIQLAISAILEASTYVPFKDAYDNRGNLLKKYGGQQEAFVRATLTKLQSEGVEYGELQGTPLPNPEGFQKILAEFPGLDVRFLSLIPSETLGEDSGGVGAQATPESIQGLVADAGVVGVDFAGAEATFTPEGMNFFQRVYALLAKRAEEKGNVFVVRPHVGEGFPDRDPKSDEVSEGSKHKEAANNNIELLLQRLKAIQTSSGLSRHIVVRFGHATHANLDQLNRARALGVIVEANLGSNTQTHSVSSEEERDQVLLRFLYAGVQTILNTDGGGVMATTLDDEYRTALTIIDSFKNHVMPLHATPETRLWFSEVPKMVDVEADKESGITHQVLPEEERGRFSLDALKKAAKDYKEQVVPHLPR